MVNSDIDMKVLSKQMKLEQALDLIRSVGGRSSLDIDNKLMSAMRLIVDAQKDCMLKYATPCNN
jgi:hypothetical protein